MSENPKKFKEKKSLQSSTYYARLFPLNTFVALELPDFSLSKR
jgi:hypothetical protein